MVARLITRLCINTGKQTDDPSIVVLFAQARFRRMIRFQYKLGRYGESNAIISP